MLCYVKNVIKKKLKTNVEQNMVQKYQKTNIISKNNEEYYVKFYIIKNCITNNEVYGFGFYMKALTQEVNTENYPYYNIGLFYCEFLSTNHIF